MYRPSGRSVVRTGEFPEQGWQCPDEFHQVVQVEPPVEFAQNSSVVQVTESLDAYKSPQTFDMCGFSDGEGCASEHSMFDVDMALQNGQPLTDVSGSEFVVLRDGSSAATAFHKDT